MCEYTLYRQLHQIFFAILSVSTKFFFVVLSVSTKFVPLRYPAKIRS